MRRKNLIGKHAKAYRSIDLMRGSFKTKGKILKALLAEKKKEKEL